MTYPQPLQIIGTGHYLPQRVISSSELEGRFDPDRPTGWIEEVQGVRERRWVEGETASQMGAEAAREALSKAGLEPTELDLIVNASGTTEQAIPDGAPLIQRELGIESSGIACMTVHTTCLSFLAALDLCGSLLATGRYRRILIVSAEITSCALNFDHIESSTLFGDAAAAVVVQQTPGGQQSCIQAARFETYGEGAYHTQVAGGGTRRHPANPETRPEDNLFYMDGRKVFRMALKYGPAFVKRLKSDLQEGFGGIKLVIPHQSSKRALAAHPRVLGVDRGRIMRTLDRYGNCVAASIPLTLHEAICQGRMTRGDQILLFGTGAGLSFGGLVLTY